MTEYKCNISKIIENVPEELIILEKWVAWRLEQRANGTVVKVPVHPITSENANILNQSTWSDLGSALHYYHRKNDICGVGFVLDHDDPYVMIKINNAFNVAGVSDTAQQLLKRFGSYAEISSSRKEIYILLKSEGEFESISQGNIELYSNRNILTITGDVISEYKRINRSNEILALHDELISDCNNNKRHNVAKQCLNSEKLGLFYHFYLLNDAV